VVEVKVKGSGYSGGGGEGLMIALPLGPSSKEK